jgi:cyclophilin family peptidyl-prolyl cis-trans isomerase
MTKCLARLGLGLLLVGLLSGCLPPEYDPGPVEARLTTSLGDIVVELDPNAAPATVANFRQYVEQGFYNGTIIHRVVPNFVIQGGGYEPGLVAKTAGAPIVNESRNGLANLRGTIAMARADDPNSATSQFFINLKDNAILNATLTQPGYAVFGTVVEGMNVVDAIAAVPTATTNQAADVPVTDVVISSATIEEGAPTYTAEYQAYLTARDEQLRTMLVQILQSVLSGSGTL